MTTAAPDRQSVRVIFGGLMLVLLLAALDQTSGIFLVGDGRV